MRHDRKKALVYGRKPATWVQDQDINSQSISSQTGDPAMSHPSRSAASGKPRLRRALFAGLALGLPLLSMPAPLVARPARHAAVAAPLVSAEAMRVHQ